jgi:hypothetical protein
MIATRVRMPSACHWMKLAAGERYLNKSSPDKLVSKNTQLTEVWLLHAEHSVFAKMTLNKPV